MTARDLSSDRGASRRFGLYLKAASGSFLILFLVTAATGLLDIMDDSIYTGYPPNLSPAQQEYLVTTIKDWAIQNGLAVRPAPTSLPAGTDANRVLATNAPVTIFPSPFPAVCFEEAKALQTIYNQLYAKITCNEEWLGKIIEE